LSDLSVTPSEVTLQGAPDQLSAVGDFVDTLPVDVSNAAGDLNVDVPLNLPADTQAIDSKGNPVKIVTVRVRVGARSGDLAIIRPVELLGVKAGITVTVDPPQVDLLLSGPLPILTQIEADPNLARVLVDASSLPSAKNTDIVPDTVVPESIQVQLVPPSVLVTLSQ
jgi:YbbR domain-containing protein